MSPNFALGHNGLSHLAMLMTVCQIGDKGQIISKHGVQVSNNVKLYPNGQGGSHQEKIPKYWFVIFPIQMNYHGGKLLVP